jgi:phasin family protein
LRVADRRKSADKPKIVRKSQPAKPAAVAETALAVVEAAKAAPAAGVEPVAAPQVQPVAEVVAVPVQPAAEAAPAWLEPAAVAAGIETGPVDAPADQNVETITQTPETGAKSMTETFNNNVNQAQQATQQAAQQATEQFRGAMNDANERGKVALEKGARVVEEMADLARGNMEAFVASSKTAAKYVETLTQGAADFNRRSFEQASATLRSFAEVKSPTDFFRLQSEFARSQFDAMVAESARVSETVVKMSGDVAEPITSRYAVAAESLKTVAA